MCERVTLYLHYDEEVGGRDRTAYRDLVKKRAEGEPVAYLVGRKEFFSLPLAVNRAVLIPRPDTETVVVEALEHLKAIDSPRVADCRRRFGLHRPGNRETPPEGPRDGHRPQPRSVGRGAT